MSANVSSMPAKHIRRLGLAVGLMLLLSASASAYDWRWQSVDGAGATVAANGGAYTLIGTAGQADAAATATGGGYGIRGGFWAGVANAPLPDALLKDGFE